MDTSLVSEKGNATISYEQSIKVYHREISQIIDDLSNSSDAPFAMLDMGCGNGNALSLLSNKNIDISVADIDEKCIDICNSRLKNISNSYFLKSPKDLELLPKNKYNCVVYSHALQYESDPISMLNLLLTLLKRDGHLIIAISNAVTPIKNLK